MLKKISTFLIILAGISCVIGGFKYLIASEFTTYHATVVGKTWSQIEPGIQAIIFGMLKIIGSGFMATGFSLLFLIIPILKNEIWALWAVLIITLMNWVPVQYVTFYLRTISPDAQTPVIPTAIIICLVVIGVGLHFLSNLKTQKSNV